MKLLEGKTVLISGAARGQGRSHAVRFAREGAAVIGFDICADLESVPYPLATQADLEETKRLVKADGGRIVTATADVRDSRQVSQVIDAGIAEFGGIDIVLANAGILGAVGAAWEQDDQVFQDVIDINLVGVWRTIKLAAPALIERRGSVVLTSSGMGIKAGVNIASYVASKHGVVGLTRSLAKELAPHGVRVNAVLPGDTLTEMISNDFTSSNQDRFGMTTAPMGIPWVEVNDITEAVLWLSSAAARYVTGILLPVDGGTAIP
jgi:SDR family mycofactocin-dependent oxidoreductase